MALSAGLLKNLKSSTLRLGKGFLFPFPARILLVVTMCLLYWLLLHFLSAETFILLGIALSFVIPAIWTSQHVLEINLLQKYYQRVLVIMGFKIGKKNTFENFGGVGIEYILVPAGKHPSGEASRSESNHRSLKMFVAYARFDEAAVEIIRDPNKEEVARKVAELFPSWPIVDLNEEPPYSQG